MKKLLLLLISVLIGSAYLIAQVANNESFDGATFPPTGWTNTAVTGTLTWNRVTTTTYPSGTSPHSGTGMTQYDAYNSNATGDGAVLISPVFSLTNRGANTPTVSYWIYRHSYYSKTPSTALDVYINTSASLTGATLLGTVYTRYDQAPVVVSDGWYQYTYNIPSGFNTGNNYIIFKATSDWYNNLHIDDIQYISYPSGPLPPASFTANAVSASQINLAFTPNASNDNVVIVYNTTGTFSTPSGTPPSPGTSFAGGTLIVNGTSSPYSHTGLTGATTYYYRAWSYNSGNYTSTGTDVNATTSLMPPYSEGFEGITANNQFPKGWAYSSDARSYTAAQTSYNQIPHTGNKFVSFYYSPSGTGYMISPGIYLSGGSVYEFSMWYITDGYSGWTNLDARFGTTQNISSMTVIPGTLKSGPVNTTYQQITGTFSPSASGVYYLGIACTHTTAPYYLSIDDINLRVSPNMGITGLTTTQVSSSITPKSVQQPVICVQFTADGGQNPLNVKQMNFNTNGTTNLSSIKNARVYYTGLDSKFNTATQFGSTVLTPGSSFNVSGNQALSQGVNYFWLAYDVVACSPTGVNIDAECTQVSYDSLSNTKSKTPSITAPSGFRQIQTSISESFEGTTFPPAGWTASIVSGSINWERVTSGTYPTNPPYSGTAMVQYNAYAASTGQAQLVSPPMDWSGAGTTTPNVSFYMYRHAYYVKTPCSNVDVYINTSPSITGATLLGSISSRYDQAPVVSAIGWYQYSYNIPSGFRGTTNYIILLVTSDYWNNVQIDNIQISNFPGTPVADFSIPDSVCIGTPVIAYNASSGSTNASWYVNGTYRSGSQNLSVIFNSLGKDTITLISENAFCSDTITKTTVVKNPSATPTSDFIADKVLIEEGENIQFTDMSSDCPTGWSWSISPAMVYDPALGMVPAYSFINSTTNYSQNPRVAFYYGGTYDVCLTTSNSLGSGTTQCKKAYITVKASVSLCVSGYNSSKLAFGNLYDDGGANSNYSANMNCNFLIDVCASKTVLTFSDFDLNTNDYLKIYDGTNNQAPKLWNTTLYPNGLTGSITSINFINSYTANSGKIYIEFISDNVTTTVGRGFNASWMSTPGTFASPHASFISEDTVCAMLPFICSNTSTGTDMSYQWDTASDGMTDVVSKDISITFGSPGKYAVTLIVQDCGGYDTFIKNIVAINPVLAPVTDFSASNLTPRKNKDAVTFINESTYCPLYHTWVFSPNKVTYESGYNQHSQNPAVTFQDTGCYTVELFDSNAFGWGNTSKTCYIHVIDYCTPAVSNKIGDIGISRVVVGSIDNSTAIGVAAYTDYSKLFSTSFEAGVTYQITLERITYSNAMSRKVWIDYNMDGDFTDSNELVAYEPAANTRTWTGSFKIPAVITTGSSILRIGTAYANQSNTPCGPNMFGEFEDYRVYFRRDATAPVITMNGPASVELSQCSTYNDPGATASDNADGNITSWIVTTNDLDISQPGTYHYRYNVKDQSGNQAIEAVRTIIVKKDTIGPNLTLLGKTEDTVLVNQSYTDPGYAASTVCIPFLNVLVTGSVDTSRVGNYTLTYTAYDSAGNFTIRTRLVHVIENIKPVIQLVGPDTLYVMVFQAYTEPGALVTDNYYTNIPFTVTGTVNTSLLGDYLLTYNATDSSGNAADPVTRLVKVVDNTIPEITSYIYNDGDTITLDVFSKFVMPYLSVTDNYYNTFTISITGNYFMNFPDGIANLTGIFTVVYNAEDGSANTGSVIFYVKVVDREKPVITLLGSPFVAICRFQDVPDDSAVVTDNYYKKLVVMKGGNYISDYLLNRMDGYYYITYDVTDSSGNKADQVLRYVIVNNCDNSIDNSSLAAYLKVYPNPSKGKFVMDFDLPSAEDVQISIVNTLGQVVKVVNVSNISQKIFNIEMDQSSEGLYFIKIQTGHEMTTIPIVISK